MNTGVSRCCCAVLACRPRWLRILHNKEERVTLVNTASLRTFRRHGGQAGDGISILQRMIVAVLMAVALCVFIAAPAHAQSTADFLDEDILGPHDSRIPGDMVVNSWRWYGIDVLPQLVIMAAETSLGDPNLGGTLVYKNNFGCMRYHGPDTKWGVLSTGRAWVAGKDWYAFPSPEVGVMALGRYLKVGVLTGAIGRPSPAPLRLAGVCCGVLRQERIRISELCATSISVGTPIQNGRCTERFRVVAGLLATPFRQCPPLR